MPLSAQEKDALTFQIAMLVEAGEPDAVIATLRRMADRMAHRATRGLIDWDEAVRWMALAEACASVEAEIEARNPWNSR